MFAVLMAMMREEHAMSGGSLARFEDWLTPSEPVELAAVPDPSDEPVGEEDDFSDPRYDPGIPGMNMRPMGIIGQGRRKGGDQ